MKRMIILAIMAALMSSDGFSRNNNEDRLKSEIALLSRKLTIIERRNKIISDENSNNRLLIRGHEAKIKEQRASIDSLELTMKQMSDAHIREIADWKSKYLSLTERSAVTEKNMNRQIGELIEKNRTTEVTLNAEIKKLNETLTANRETCDKNTERLKNESRERESVLTKKIDDLALNISRRDEVIATYEKLNKDMEARLADMGRLDEERKKKIGDLEAALKSVSENLAKKESEVLEHEKRHARDRESIEASLKKERDHESKLKIIAAENDRLAAEVKRLEAKISEFEKKASK